MTKNAEFKGLGRRKTSIAKVKLVPGTGKILVNKIDPQTYFPNSLVIQDMMQPLVVTNTQNSYDISVVVTGGGFTGQAGAIRLGISRALIEINNEFKPLLKSQGLVKRDSRCKERKKFGLYGARRAPQFTKR